MNYSIGNMLGGGMVGGLDPSAKAYIDAVVAAGATVTLSQKGYINNFIKEEKAASRWTIHKRIYFPIWGVASPNAIDMVSLTSGTFVNSPTMGSGFIKGNATSQYFNINTTLGSLGVTSSDASYIIGLKAEATATTRANLGALSTLAYLVDFRFDAASGRRLTLLQSDTIAAGSFDTSQRTGVIVATRTSAAQYTVHNSTSDLGTKIYAAGVPTVNPYVMARNNNGTPDIFGNSEIAFFGFGLGLSTSDAKAYALAMKNLWQNCTGLTLP